MPARNDGLARRDYRKHDVASLDDVATELGVTRQRVMAIERRALWKLRMLLDDMGLDYADLAPGHAPGWEDRLPDYNVEKGGNMGRRAIEWDTHYKPVSVTAQLYSAYARPRGDPGIAWAKEVGRVRVSNEKAAEAERRRKHRAIVGRK